MAWELCSSTAAIAKAGTNAASAAINSYALMEKWSEQAEGTLCLKTRKDWTSTSVAAVYQPMLSDACSDLMGIKIINWDMSGYLKGEAQTMLDVLKDNFNQIISDLRQQEYQEKIL